MGDGEEWKYDVETVVGEMAMSSSIIPSPCYGIMSKSEARSALTCRREIEKNNFFIFELKVAKGKESKVCDRMERGGAASRVLRRMRGFCVLVNRSIGS